MAISRQVLVTLSPKPPKNTLTVTQQCWERLHNFGLENSVFNDNENDNTFKFQSIFSIQSAGFLLLFLENLPLYLRK